MLDRKQKAFTIEDIKAIADTFHAFKSGTDYKVNSEGREGALGYEDIAGEYYSATTEEIAKQEYILTPGRYVGIAEEEDDGIPFKEKMDGLTATLSEQFKQSAKLEAQIKKNFAELGYES